jgi:hypothetical protein
VTAAVGGHGPASGATGIHSPREQALSARAGVTGRVSSSRQSLRVSRLAQEPLRIDLESSRHERYPVPGGLSRRDSRAEHASAGREPARSSALVRREGRQARLRRGTNSSGAACTAWRAEGPAMGVRAPTGGSTTLPAGRRDRTRGCRGELLADQVLGRCLHIPERGEGHDHVGGLAEPVLPRGRRANGEMGTGEHVFGRVGGGSDGRVGMQAVLQGRGDAASASVRRASAARAAPSPSRRAARRHIGPRSGAVTRGVALPAKYAHSLGRRVRKDPCRGTGSARTVAPGRLGGPRPPRRRGATPSSPATTRRRASRARAR